MKVFLLIVIQFFLLVFKFTLALQQNDLNLLSKLPPAMGSNGTLIDPSWILTSTGYNPESIIIGGIERNVDKAITHPQWTERKTDYDLQLLHLSNPINNFKPIDRLRYHCTFGIDQPVILLGANPNLSKNAFGNKKLLDLDVNKQACNYRVSGECTLFKGSFFKKILLLNNPEQTNIRYFEPNNEYDSGAGIFIKDFTQALNDIDQYYLISICTNIISDWRGSYALGINPIFKSDISAWIDQEICKDALSITLPQNNSDIKTTAFVSNFKVVPSLNKNSIEKSVKVIEQPSFANFIPVDYENIIQGMLQDYLATLVDPSWLLTLSDVDLPEKVRINKKNYKINFKVYYPEELDQYKRRLILAHLEMPVERLSPVQRKRLVINQTINDGLVYISASCKLPEIENEDKLTTKEKRALDKRRQLAEEMNELKDRKVVTEVQFKNQEVDKTLVSCDLECVSGSGFYGPLPKEKTIDLLSKTPQFLKGIRNMNKELDTKAYENIFNDPLAEIKPLASFNNKTYAAKVSLYALGSENKVTYYKGKNYYGSNIVWLTQKLNSWIDHQILLYNLNEYNND